MKIEYLTTNYQRLRICLIRLHQGWLQNNTDTIAAIICILLGIIISLSNLIRVNTFTITLGPILILVSLLYLFLRRKLLSNQLQPETQRITFLSATIAFWIAFSISIYSLSTEILHRPALYFIMTAISAAIIGIQIFSSAHKSASFLIITEIIILSLGLRASAYWVFPSLAGSDTWAHYSMTKAILSIGHIPESTQIPAGLTEMHTHFPVFHLNVGAMKLVTGMDYKTVVFLSTTLPMVLATGFIFLIGSTLINARVGLLSMLLLNISDYHIHFSVQTISTSLGAILFPIILYLLIKQQKKPQALVSLLIILIILALIISHPLSTTVMLFTALFLLFGALIYRLLYKNQADSEGTIVSPTLISILLVGTISYWMYVVYVSPSVTLFEMLLYGFGQQFARSEVVSYTKPYFGPGYILNITGFLILILFAIPGCLLWLSRLHSDKTRVAFVITLTGLFAIMFGLPSFGILIMIPERWFLFAYVLTSLMAACGIIAIVSIIRHSLFRNLLLAGIIGCMSFFMITQRLANVDSPVYTPELNQRLVYSGAELALAAKSVEIYDAPITADRQFRRVVQFEFGRFPVGYRMSPDSQGLIIWRNVMRERPVLISRYPEVLGDSFEDEMDGCCHIIYTNNDGHIYLSR